MFVVVHAVVRKIKGVGCVVCGMFLCAFGSYFRVRSSYKKNLNNLKTLFQKPSFFPALAASLLCCRRLFSVVRYTIDSVVA